MFFQKAFAFFENPQNFLRLNFFFREDTKSVYSVVLTILLHFGTLSFFFFVELPDKAESGLACKNVKWKKGRKEEKFYDSKRGKNALRRRQYEFLVFWDVF